MPERPRERPLGPPELEREQAEPDRDERNAGAREHEQCEPREQRGEPAEREEGADDERPLPVPRTPLAQALQRGHATAAPTRSPSLRSR